jgi:hypothetical protein
MLERRVSIGAAVAPAQLGNAGPAAQAIQHDVDLLLGRVLLAGCPADVPNNPLRRWFSSSGFLSHLHSSAVTMSQKFSFLQAAKSVSQVLTGNNLP